jgi:hypothetical protein
LRKRWAGARSACRGLAGLVEAVEVDAKQVFAEIDQWIVDAAALCLARDPQLDLRGALPAVPAASRRKPNWPPSPEKGTT